MANHEKRRKQGVPYPIPTSLFSQMQHFTHCGMNQVGLFSQMQQLIHCGMNQLS